MLRQVAVLILLSCLILTACAQTQGPMTREQAMQAALKKTAVDLGWSPNIIRGAGGYSSKTYGVGGGEMKDEPEDTYIYVAGTQTGSQDRAYISVLGVDGAKAALSEMQYAGMRSSRYKGFDAVVMGQGEEICEAGGYTGMVLWAHREVAGALAEMFGFANFDKNSVCLETTGTVAWRCGDLLMVVNSPYAKDNSKNIASKLHKNIKDARLCAETVLNGTVKDYYGDPMPYMQVKVSYDGKDYNSVTDKDGFFEFMLKDFFPSKKNPPEAKLKLDFNYLRDGKNYFNILSKTTGTKHIWVEKTIKFESESQRVQDIRFNTSYSGTVKQHGEYKSNAILSNLRHFSVSYFRMHQAVDFALNGLKVNLDYKLPVEVFIGYSDGTYYSPSTSYIAIDASDAGFSNRESPQNREFHEFGHHVQYDVYGGWPQDGSMAGTVNHDGYINPSTADSFMEGFAEFYALMAADYNGYPNPGVYCIFGSMEKNYRPWMSRGYDEEFAVASLLWDLYDKDDDKGDSLTLSREQIWDWLKVRRANFYEYYAALKKSNRGSSKAIDDVFISHGFFADTQVGNKKWDAGEPLRDANKDKKYSTGEEYVDIGTPELLKRPWQIYDKGEKIGAATNYARKNRTKAVMVPDAFIKVDDLRVKVYNVTVSDADGTSYSYEVEQKDGLIYLPPIPGDDNSTVTVRPSGVAFKSDNQLVVDSGEYADKYANTAPGAGYVQKHDFKLKATGEKDTPYEGGIGVEPDWVNPGDELRDGDKVADSMSENEGGCLCIPALMLAVTALGAAASKALFGGI